MKKNILIIGIVILIIIAGGVYYWTRPQPATGELPTAEVEAVLEKLQHHIILPTDEIPQIGQINDPVEAVKTQPFLAGVQKGDLLIVYVKASKAIVYSPGRDLIVNVGPISTDPNQPVDEASVSDTTDDTPEEEEVPDEE